MCYNKTYFPSCYFFYCFSYLSSHFIMYSGCFTCYFYIIFFQFFFKEFLSPFLLPREKQFLPYYVCFFLTFLRFSGTLVRVRII